ncbi:MAG: hypothetical protein ACRDFA_09075 [bacterium]
MARASVLLLLAILASAASAAAEGEVVISAQRVDPPVLRVLPDERVVFVNRSGRSVHIDLVGDAKQHHVFRMSGAIWAIFHRPGRHAYIVHFEEPGGGLLRGVIEVTQEDVSESAPPTCPVTVMGVCLEP